MADRRQTGFRAGQYIGIATVLLALLESPPKGREAAEGITDAQQDA
jgi:hypothetical protein